MTLRKILLNNYRTLFCMLLVALSTLSRAADFKQVVSRESQDIGLTETPASQTWNPEPITIQDQFFDLTPPAGTLNNISITGMLKLNDRYRIKMKNVKITIEYTIDLYDEYDVLTQTITNETLSIHYLLNDKYTDIDQQIYWGYHKAVVSITNIDVCQLNPDGSVLSCNTVSSLSGNDAYIFKDLSMEWQCTSNRALTVENVASVIHTYTDDDTQNPSPVCSTSCPQNIIRIAWPYTYGAESYDLEWIFLDMPQISSISDGFRFDWRDATRINTTGNFFDVPLLYPKGAIAYRVRSIGMDATGQRVEGTWTRNPSGHNDRLQDLPGDCFIFCGMETGLNWTSSLSFAEEGKSKGVVSFVDGTGRTRQTITTLSTDENTIVAEPSLDHMGRPAVNFLPVPVKEEQFKYFPGFNAGFGADEYDSQTSYPTGSPVDGITGSNAVKDFYTSDNPFIQLSGTPTPYEQYMAGLTSYLPSAGDYPFTQTRMMNDGSGRPHSSSGVGATHALGGDHDTKYYYGTPGSQKEIDRLFGSEAGFVSYYKKNMVVDANGQISISYLDGYGRTVATALAGTNTENLLVPISEAPAPIITSLTDNNQLLPDNSLVSTKDILVGIDTEYEFSYSIDPAEFEHLCLGSHGCVYEFLITVKDDEGTEQQTVTPVWQDVSTTTFPYEFTVPLVVGKYTITKTLRLKESAVATFIPKFDEMYGNTWSTTTNTCFTAPFESSCFTCEEQCIRGYKYTITYNGNTYTIYRRLADSGLDYTTSMLVADGILDEDGGAIYKYIPTSSGIISQAEANITDCQENCNVTPTVNVNSECEMKRIILIRDVLPDGQYFENRPKDPEYSGIDNTLYTTGSESNPNNRNAWLEAYASDLKDDFGSLLNPAITSPSWEDIRDHWGSIDPNSTAFATLKQELVQRHPEYCLWKSFCEPEYSTCSCLHGQPLYTDIDEYANLMANTEGDENAKDLFLFIPVGAPSSIGPIGGWNNQNYFIKDSVGDKCVLDPLFYCYTDSVEPMYKRLSEHLTITVGGIPKKISIWYIIQDPDNIRSHDLALGSHPQFPNDFVEYMQLLHGSPANPTGGMLAPYNVTPVGSQMSRWQYFRSVYTFHRMQFLNRLAIVNAQQCMSCDDPQGPIHPLCEDIEDNANNACNTGVSCTKLPFLSAWDYNDDSYVDMGSGLGSFNFKGMEIRYPYIGLMNTTPSGPNLQNQHCETNCSGLATQWINQLQGGVRGCAGSAGGPTAYTTPAFTIPEADVQMLRAYFINICSNACESQASSSTYSHDYTTYPFTAPDWAGTPYGLGAYNGSNVIQSINDVVERYMDVQNIQCPVLINTIPAGSAPAPDVNALSCSCDNLSYFITANDGLNAAYTSINPLHWEMFSSTGSVVFNFDHITDALEGSSNISPTYQTLFQGLTNTQQNNAILYWLDACMNNPQAEIPDFMAGTQAVEFPEFMNCGNSMEPIAGELDCEATELIQREAVNSAAYQAFRNQQYGEFITDYTSHCMELAQGNETFDMSYQLQEYHYTLYYYDQAGNLVKTVPPAGVAIITDNGTLNGISTFRKAHHYEADYSEQSGFYWPAHTKITNYVYNGQNQVVQQTTPDAGTSYFMYDALGRMALSQNAQQIQDEMVSYSLYDAIGRIREVGAMGNPTGTSGRRAMQNFSQQFAPNMGEPTPLEESIENGRSGKKEITATRYDGVDWINLGFDVGVTPFAQENLRNRVSSTFYYAVYPSNDEMAWYDNATHYSYDIHGNVKRLAQDIPALQDAKRRFLFTDYDYDLVSGKVNEVHYMKGYDEQFSHYYHYDADNRLTRVLTSKNEGQIKELEAKYFYYPTGPLARVELGRNQVQGLDYAYTIQGWLKGMNADVTNTYHDIGLDANYNPDNLHALFGMDGAGFTLGYFGNDYQSVGTTRRFESEIYNTDAIASLMHPNISGLANWGLYNGNIPLMSAAGLDCDQVPMPTLGRSFMYDQLNRITTSSVFLKDYNGDLQSNAGPQWAGVSQANLWNSGYYYDADGNITGTLVEGDNGTMDNLKYYYTGSNNQLQYVEDAVANGDYAMDIDNQLPGNYGYDLRGNLVSDVAGGITQINWNVYGKVKSVLGTTIAKNTWLGYNPGGQRIVKISAMDDLGDLTKPYGKASFYVLDAQGNTMAIYEYREDQATERNELVCTEQMVYGTSRLGMVHREQKICDDCVSIDALENSLYEKVNAIEYQAPGLLEAPYLQAQLGTREYELTNHLGNVLSTVADRKTWLETDVLGKNTNALVFQYRPEVVTAGDYYPFGMKLPGRGCPPLVCETSEQTSFAFSEDFSSSDGGFLPFDNTIGISSGRLGMGGYSSGTVGAYKTFAVLASKAYTVTFDITKITCTPGTITVNIMDAANNIVATAVYGSTGSHTFSFTPPTSETYTIAFIGGNGFGPGGGSVCNLSIDNVVVSYKETLYANCTAEGSYRFGFNGETKDDEWSGDGNMYDYGFRIYDPRIGRFLSVDPLTKSYPMLTPYQFAANMPTWAADLDGLEAIIHNQNDNSITIIGNIYIVSEGKGKLNSTKIKTMTEERIVNQLSDIESTIGGSQIKIKLNYITEDKDGNPLTYSSAVESAKNSVVTYTSSDGEKTDIAGWQTGVVVSTDEVGGSAFPDFQPGLMTPGSTNKAEGRGEFNSIRINRNLVQKMNGSGGAEAAAHEIAHFLGRRGLGGEPNNTQKYDHAGGVGGTDPGATSNKDENVRLVPSDLAPMVRGANKEGIRVTIPKK